MTSPVRPCERNLAREGPCYGPTFPAEVPAGAYARVAGRWLCDRHAAAVDELLHLEARRVLFRLALAKPVEE